MFEAYKIGVTLSLTNHVSQGLRLMATDFAKTEAQATALQKRIDLIQRDAVKGGLMLGAGVGILSLFKAPLNEARKYEREFANFKLFGMTSAQNAEAANFVNNMNAVGTSYVDNMRLMTEAQGVFRESGMLGDKALEGAKIAAPVLAKIQFTTEALHGESKEKMHTQSLAMLRFIEMRGGLKDAVTFNRIADDGWKAIQSSGGNVNWEQLRQFMARGGVAAQHLTDATLFGKLEPIISELKGSTAGNGWMTAYNRLVGGVRIPNQIAHLLAENGIWDKTKIEWNSQGGIKRFDGNPLKDMKTFAADPVEFYEKRILPMYARMNGGKGLGAEERARENTLIFGRTGGAMFSLIDRQIETIHRSVTAWNKALGVNQSAKVAEDSPDGKFIVLHKQWDNVLRDLGLVVLPYAISGVEKLTGALRWADGWIKRNETGVKLLSGALAILAGGLMMRGTVLLLSAAFRGLGLALMFEKVGGVAGIKNIGTALGGPISQLGKLGAAANVAGAAFAGWELGTWLNKTFIEGTKFSEWLGGFLAHLMAPFSKDARDAIRQNTGKEWYQFGPTLTEFQPKPNAPRWYPFGSAPPAIAAGQQRPVVVHAGSNDNARPVAPAPYAAPKPQTVQMTNNTYLDGRLIARDVVERVVQESMRPASGLSGVDPRMGFMSPSMAR